MRRFLAAVLLVLPGLAGAAVDAPARVALLQPPAWIERAGTQGALPPGAMLRPGDRIETGAAGRVHLALADGSVVKLGSEAQFELPALTADGEVLRGVLRVVKGAFRYTTLALGALRRRELDVHIGPTITAGIRGTDIWGKSDPARELLCLIEGSVEVASPGAAPQRMDQPLTFYVVPRGEPPLPVQPTPPGQIEQWAVQTEMRAQAPALRADGARSVALASYAARVEAQAAAARLSAEGYAAEVIAARVRGVARHRLVLRGFGSLEDARAFLDTARQLGFPTPWVLPPG